VARFVEWHLAGGAQPLALVMNEGICLAVEADQQRIQRRLDTGYCDAMACTLDEARIRSSAGGRTSRLGLADPGSAIARTVQVTARHTS
jgi:urocanate hydratase